MKSNQDDTEIYSRLSGLLPASTVQLPSQLMFSCPSPQASNAVVRNFLKDSITQRQIETFTLEQDCGATLARTDCRGRQNLAACCISIQVAASTWQRALCTHVCHMNTLFLSSR